MLRAMNIIGLYVEDVARSVAFYSSLGFDLIKDDGEVGEVKLGQMRLQFTPQQSANRLDESFRREAFGKPKGTGIYLNIEVDNADAMYEIVVNLGIKPSSAPRTWPWGHREFVVRDPDRYKLVFYQRLS